MCLELNFTLKGMDSRLEGIIQAGDGKKINLKMISGT